LFGDAAPRLAAFIDDLEAAVRDGIELQQDCAGVDTDSGEIAASLELLVAMQRETRAALEFVAVAGNEDWAFYIEWGTGGAALRDIAAAPLDVAADVQRLLAATRRPRCSPRRRWPWAATSSTSCAASVSAGATQLVVPSPFDYPAQCLVGPGGRPARLEQRRVRGRGPRKCWRRMCGAPAGACWCC
jgi:hypothetical protein